jgi:small subunit ribosomal protein S8e
MVVIHGKSKRKPTGGRYTDRPTKRLMQKGSHAAHTKVAETQKKTLPTKGGGEKIKLFAADKVNLYDPKAKKYSMETIKNVSENSADRHFVRHNILTKGAVIATSKGKAKVTSRPGQEGSVNAVLIE